MSEKINEYYNPCYTSEVIRDEIFLNVKDKLLYPTKEWRFGFGINEKRKKTDEYAFEKVLTTRYSNFDNSVIIELHKKEIEQDVKMITKKFLKYNKIFIEKNYLD